MKRVIILISLITVFSFITGCSSKARPEKIANAIVELHQNKKYEEKLNKKEKKLLDEFMQEQLPENKEVNLSKLDIFYESNRTDEIMSDGIYMKNSDYYIRYRDIDFIRIIESELEDEPRIVVLAELVCDGYNIDLYKDMIPIIYQDTKEDPIHNYRYLYTEKTERYTDVYYRSLADYTYILKIRFNMSNNEITYIDTTYGFIDIDESKIVKLDNTDNKVFIIGTVIVSIVAFVSIGIYLFYKYKKKLAE